MAAVLAPQPTFVPHVVGDDDPVCLLPAARALTASGGRRRRHDLDLTRFAFWFAYLAVVVAGISYAAAAVGSLFGASWLGIVPATAATLLVVYSFVGRLRPTLS